MLFVCGQKSRKTNPIQQTGRHFEKKSQRFDRSTWNLACRRISAIRTVPAVQILNFYNFKMADGYHLEKYINCHISATLKPIGAKCGTLTLWIVPAVKIWPIGIQFGMETHIGPPNCASSQKLKISNFYTSKMADGRHLEKSKMATYNCLTNHHKIWHSKAYRPSEPYWQLKLRTFQNQDCGWMPYRRLLNHHSLPTVWPIAMKFGKWRILTVCCLHPNGL